jgi:hypothetical protein
MALKQWSTPDGQIFFPAGDVVKQLPPGYYSIDQDMSGLFFKKMPLKTEKLLDFPDSASHRVLEEIEKFWTLEESFREANIPYKRGMLLYGPPGGGKTCTMRLVIEQLIKEHEGIVADFNGTHLFREGYNILRTIHPKMPLIILMEDVDAILSRYNESEVLNLLDGMYGVDRILWLATTNYPERLGSRIMNRPSRFDKKIFIGMPSAEAREMFVRSKIPNDKDAIIERWVKDTKGLSIAHINELFVVNRILGEEYETAVATLRKMHKSPTSSSFDPYRVEKTPKLDYVEQYEEAGVELARMHESKERYYKAISEGRIYKEWRKGGGGKVLTEDAIVPGRRTGRKPRALTPDEIAAQISDDISANNGLTF